MAVYSVSTASSPLFDISPTRSFVTSLTEINVTDEPLFLYGLFFSVLHSLSHHSQQLSPPPRASLRPLGVVFRSLSSARGTPTLTRERGVGANVASHAHSPRAGAWAGVTAARGVAVETATSRCRGDITSYDLREARELTRRPFASIRGYVSN